MHTLDNPLDTPPALGGYYLMELCTLTTASHYLAASVVKWHKPNYQVLPPSRLPYGKLDTPEVQATLRRCLDPEEHVEGKVCLNFGTGFVRDSNSTAAVPLRSARQFP